MLRRTSRKSPVFIKYKKHKKLYGIIEGAIEDAFKQHPNYLTDLGRDRAVQSVAKRMIGQIISNRKLIQSLVLSDD